MCSGKINFLISFFYQSSEVAYHVNLSFNIIIFCALVSVRQQSTPVPDSATQPELPLPDDLVLLVTALELPQLFIKDKCVKCVSTQL